MLACIEKLSSSKYYSTTINVRSKDLATSFTVRIPGYVPSGRQLEEWGYEQEDWDNNVNVDNGWGGLSPIREMDLCSDGHYENKETFNLAKLIAALLNTVHDEDLSK